MPPPQKICYLRDSEKKETYFDISNPLLQNGNKY